jgi:hypothetical protein
MVNTQLTRDEILAATHRLIQEDLQGLEENLASAPSGTPAQLGDRLTALRTHLTEQFRHEEQGGYAEDVLTHAPQQERAVRKLLDEHAGLTMALDELVEQARARASIDDAFCEKVRAWIHNLREHESRENALLEDAFNVECCAED